MTESLAMNASLEGLLVSRREKLAEAWAGFVLPLVAGDADAFRAHAAGLGIRGDSEAGPGAVADDLFETLRPYFEGASIDTARVEPRRPDPADPRAIPRMPTMPPGASGGAGPDRMPAIAAMRMRTENREGNGETVTSEAIMIPLRGAFPEAADAERTGGEIVELVAPVRMDGAREPRPDHAASLIFVYSERAGGWRPLAARLVLLTDRAAEVRSNRP